MKKHFTINLNSHVASLVYPRTHNVEVEVNGSESAVDAVLKYIDLKEKGMVASGIANKGDFYYTYRQEEKPEYETYEIFYITDQELTQIKSSFILTVKSKDYVKPIDEVVNIWSALRGFDFLTRMPSLITKINKLETKLSWDESGYRCCTDETVLYELSQNDLRKIAFTSIKPVSFETLYRVKKGVYPRGIHYTRMPYPYIHSRELFIEILESVINKHFTDYTLLEKDVIVKTSAVVQTKKEKILLQTYCNEKGIVVPVKQTDLTVIKEPNQ